MSGSWKDSLIRQLHYKEFRYLVRRGGYQDGNRLFRSALYAKLAQLSQADLGFLAGNAQSAIARLEDPNYGRFSLTTLLEVASTFDVALLVRFVPFSELVRRNTDLSPDAICVPDFSHDYLGGSINRRAFDLGQYH